MAKSIQASLQAELSPGKMCASSTKRFPWRAVFSGRHDLSEDLIQRARRWLASVGGITGGGGGGREGEEEEDGDEEEKRE